MLPSHTTWFTLCVIEHFILNSECHVTTHASSNVQLNGLRCHVLNLFELITCYYMWHGTHMHGDGVAGSKLTWT